MVDRLPPTKDPRCGTSAGYQVHWLNGEDACEPCKEANKEKSWSNRHPGMTREEYAEKNKRDKEEAKELFPKGYVEPKPERKPPRITVYCGTRVEYTRHLERGEEACDACKKAHADALWESRNPGKSRDESPYIPAKDRKAAPKKPNPRRPAGSTAHLSKEDKNEIVNRAIRRLVARHRNEFHKLVEAEQANVL